MPAVCPISQGVCRLGRLGRGRRYSRQRILAEAEAASRQTPSVRLLCSRDGTLLWNGHPLWTQACVGGSLVGIYSVLKAGCYFRLLFLQVQALKEWKTRGGSSPVYFLLSPIYNLHFDQGSNHKEQTSKKPAVNYFGSQRRCELPVQPAHELPLRVIGS